MIFDNRSITGIAIGTVTGIVTLFLFDPLLLGLLSGTLVTAVMSRGQNWKISTKLPALTGGILAASFATINKFGNLDSSTHISFAFIDNYLLMFTLGTLAGALIGALAGITITVIFQRYKEG